MKQKNIANWINWVNKSKVHGFTAFELIGSLAVVALLVFMANKLNNSINTTKQSNQLADQGNSFTKIAAKYIEDNYRSLVNQVESGNDVIIPYTVILSHTPESFSVINRQRQFPCIYITSDANTRLKSSFRTYLIFGEATSSGKAYSEFEIANIAHTIGGNAGLLVKESDTYKFRGGIMADNLNLSSSTAKQIASVCGFVNPLAQNSLIVDLSNHKLLFAALKGEIDQQSSRYDSDPSLKKSQLINMQTNVYLDNVYKESSIRTDYYCDTAQLPIAGANTLCQNNANTSGNSIYPGTVTWSSSIRDGNSCLATARAHFYKTLTSYSCASMGNAANYCPAVLGDKTIVSGSGYWRPNPPELRGTQCIANAYATYKTLDCDFMSSCKYISGTNQLFDCSGTLNQFCPTFSGYWPAGIVAPAAYNPQLTGSTCKIHFYCRNFKDQYNPEAGASGELPANVHSYPDIFCGQNIANAQVTQSTTDLGFRDCGVTAYSLLTSQTGIPAEHVYRAMDYGNSNINGQRIQIKSNAPSGATSMNSTLAVNNAGLQSGIIQPISHALTAGTTCSPTEFGKTVQDKSSVVINSQIQCTYNPTFCRGSGYCYLPVKNTTFDYEFAIYQVSYTCPLGTVVDGNQPTDNIDTKVSCPLISGWSSTQSVHGEGTDCYIGITGVSFCQGYQSVCTYVQGKKAVAALKKLRCTSSTTTYTVDNYTQ